VTITNPKNGKKGVEVTFEGTPSGSTGLFQVTSDNCPSVLEPGKSCVLKVNFSPDSKGKQKDGLLIMDNADGNPQTVKLTGTGK
jgi:hypothetical protein